MNRFTRQMRLADVGEAGQARLSAATVAPRTEGFARTIEETYLRGAGVAVKADRGEAVDVSALGLRNAAAREVGEGAYAALLAIREVLA